MLFLVSLQYIVWNEQRRLWGRAGVFLWALARGAVVPSAAVPSCSWEVPGQGCSCACAQLWVLLLRAGPRAAWPGTRLLAGDAAEETTL